MKSSQFSTLKRANSAKLKIVEPLKQWEDPQNAANVMQSQTNNFMKTGFAFNSQNLQNLRTQTSQSQRQKTLPRHNSAVTLLSKQLPPVFNIKNIVNINNAKPIQVVPAEIIFQDIKANQTYETFVVVQSLSKVLKRIKIIQPKTVRFRVDYDQSGKIAAGLSIKLLITFETNVLDSFHDKLIIQYEDEDKKCDIEVPLHAFCPQATMIFEPFLNFGFVKIFENNIRTILFKNEGKMMGKVRLKYDSLNEISCDPSSFSVQPGQEFPVKVTFNSKDGGIFRGKIEVVNEGQSLLKYIDVNATAVEFNKYFIDDQGTSTSTFEFGETYFGEKKIIKGFLVNNTPHDQKFKVNMRIGYHSNSDEKVSLLTPVEVGLEQTEQIMKCQPERGSVKAYSQIGISFICHSKVKFEHQIITKNYALSDQELVKRKESEEDYTYSAIFEFEGPDKKEDIVPITLIGRCLCPKIKINKALLNFGECQVHDHRESMFLIENKHNLMPIEVKIPRIPSFFVDPDGGFINPGVKSSFIATFQPSTVGKYKTQIFVTLMNGQYKIPLQVVGESNNFLDSKYPKTRGPESMPKDFKLPSNFIDEHNQMNTQGGNTKKGQMKSMNESSSLIQMPRGIDELEMNFEKLEEFKTMKDNKNKYIGMLRDNRQSRVLKEKEKIVKLRLDQMETKLKEKGLTLFQDNGDDDNEEKDPRKTVPLDIEFELGMMETKVFPPNEMLSTLKDPLYVSKPIGKYEPQRDEQAKTFNPDPNIPMRKPFPEVAKTHKEIRDVRMELEGEMLQKINIGPKVIDFGPVYVESKVVKRFCVKNDLRTSIKVQLSTIAPELQGTYQKAQIIPSSETARFDVELYSTNLNDNYAQTIKYVINDRHQFEFQVKAKIEKVKLDLSRTNIQFRFLDDSTNMETIETLKITNSGNAEGHYKWDTNSKVFIVHPSSGVVPSGGSVETYITYRPSASNSAKESQQGGLRTETDKLVIHVTNGLEQSVKCEGFVNEAKCFIRQASIELGQLIVSKEETRVFVIKNNSRIPAVFRVLTEKLPENCIVTPVVGRIQQDGQIDCQVKYSCREEKEIKTDICILIRGGKILRLPFNVQTVIPNVVIKEEVFNFGQLTKDNAGHLEMNLVNNSEIPAELILDMRTEEKNPDCPDGIGCLQITPIDEGDESILKSVHQDFIGDEDEERRNDGNSDMDIDPDDQSIQSEESLQDASPHKKFNITIKPNQSLRFQLTFIPNDAKPYNFELPITLARFGALPGLIRNIICRGIKSQFLIQPQNIDFPRKIITTSDKDYPENFEVTLSNPERKAVTWRIDDTPFQKLKKLFSIHPTYGRIEPGQNQIIKASFDPKEPGEYEETISLFIDGDEGQSSTPVHKIQVKGVAAFPKLLFDRREVLLPVVPIGIESKCVFRIINDGYENLKIKHQVLEELGNIKVDCRFPEGKNLNVSKNKLKVEVYFSAKKPISFTTNIEFKDDKNKGYIIPVSGTTDNSLLTIFPYMQRCKGEYRTEISQEKNALVLVEEDVADDQSDITTNNNASQAKRKYAASVASAKTHSSRASVRSTRSALGYTPVPKEMLEHSKDQIKNWLNFTVLSENIQNFPDTIIEESGDQLYELLQFLLGQKHPIMETKAVFEGSLNRTERSILLFQQYDSLIRILKQDGALLNHIRPLHLLGYNEFHAYIKTLPKEEIQTVHPNGLKVSLHRYTYFQADAWITLFYQIIKIYFLSRISTKNIKSIPNIHPDKATIPDYYLSGSNIYSQYEGILLRWLELNHEIINPHQPIRITSFDKELASGHLIANLIKNYLGIEQTAHLFQQMKPICNTDDENFFNCDKVHHALQEINLQTPFNAVDLSKASQRETVLFLIQIFNSLPNYIPKGPPIIFSCVLGEEVTKTIELTNQSNKSIHYWVKFTGCQDFQIEADTIKLEPKSVFKFKVKFVSRVSQPVYGRIRFTNRRESNVAAAALVFDFKSNITGRVSQKFIDVDCPLYQKKEFSIKVENKFLNYNHAEFQVTIVHEFETKEKKDTEVNKQKGKDKNGNANKTQKRIAKPDELQPLEVLNAVPSFFIKQADTMVIKRGNFSHLNLVFIPILYETQKCFVIFSDPTVGEFQYEIIGTVQLPEEIIQIPETPIQPPIYVDEQRNWPFKIPFKNEAMREARKNIEYYMTQRKKKDFDPKKYTLPNPSPDVINFYVEMEQPHSGIISTSKTIVLENPIRASKRKPETQKLDQSIDSKRMDGLSMISSIAPTNVQKSIMMNETMQEVDSVEKNSMYLNFNFKQPIREYTTFITLRNPEKYDIRRYKLIVTSLPKPIKAMLELTAPAQETIVQDIPVVNPSEKDWMIKVNLYPNEEMNGKCFFVGNKSAQLPQSDLLPKTSNLPNQNIYQSIRDILVKKKSTYNVQVSFTPQWICEAEARLVMSNPATNDVFEYELKGIGEEPLAVDHLIINCQARTSTKQELVIKNPYADKSITYEVETDLVGASGPPTLTIGPNKKGIYTLIITPLLSGQYTGSITFTDTSTGQYIWWTALLNTQSPPSIKKIDLITSLRKAIAFDIEINNPSNDTANFEVFIEGDGLVGIPYMQIPPKSQQIYELFFLPLKIGKQQGSIAFVSDNLGEIWYELNLVAEDSQAIRLPMLKTELGKVEQHEVRLDNPSNEDVRVYTYISNQANFDVLPEQIIIPANDEVSVNIRYMPSVLESTQTSDIRFQTDNIGRWDFLAFGMGIPPTQFEPKIVTIGLNKDFSSVIHFKNPFKDQIQVNVLLDIEDESVKDVIQLLTKKHGKEENINVSGLGVLQIPFSFTPREIRCYECKIVVSMNDKIQWKYPIQAITESYSTGILSTFKTKCRVFYEGEFKLTLPGITEVYGDKDTFEFEIRNLPNNLESVISKSFQVKMIKNTLSNKSDSLNFVGRFHPMKPFKTNIDFIVHRKMGGLWKFKIQLESTPPNEDDMIVLSTPLDTVDTVTFRLTNRFKSFATFSAKYTPDSDPEFSITPQTGILEPYGRDGTLFSVSFSPVEYGKAKTGKLIIETEDMYWSYLIKGVLPKYEAPIIATSKINNRLGIDVTTNWKHQKKNYLSDNIRKTKENKQQNANNTLALMNKTVGNTTFMKKSILSQNERQSILEGKSIVSNKNTRNPDFSLMSNRFFKN